MDTFAQRTRFLTDVVNNLISCYSHWWFVLVWSSRRPMRSENLSLSRWRGRSLYLRILRSFKIHFQHCIHYRTIDLHLDTWSLWKKRLCTGEFVSVLIIVIKVISNGSDLTQFELNVLDTMTYFHIVWYC